MNQTKPFISFVRVTLGILVVGSLIGFLCSHAIQTTAQNPQFRPFVLIERDLYFSKGDPVPKERDFLIARRADGSLMRSWVTSGSDSPDGTDGKYVMIWDVASREQVTLEPFTKSMITMKLSETRLTDFLASERACSDIITTPTAKKEDGNVSTILGYAVVSVNEKTDSAEVQSWVAPDLECFSLKRTTQFRDSAGQDDGHTDVTVTQVTEGPPPQSLFTLPADYAERSPAEVESIFVTQHPGHRLLGSLPAQALEQKYQEGRKQ